MNLRGRMADTRETGCGNEQRHFHYAASRMIIRNINKLKIFEVKTFF